MGFIRGEGRTQGTLFPVTLEELIPADHICRVIDAFVDRLDMAGLGFERADPADTGRPGYDPRDLPNRGSHFHVSFHWLRFLQPAVEACPAHLGQLTHALDRQAALQRHHFPDFIVDAFSPDLLLCWRRASTFCKALLKKSTSSVFSARTRLDDSPLCALWMRATFAQAVFPPRIPLDPVHRATDRADAAILPAPLRVPRCSRILSVAPLPPAGSAPNTLSLPLAVPFLHTVSCFTVSFLGFTPPPAVGLSAPCLRTTVRLRKT